MIFVDQAPAPTAALLGPQRSFGLAGGNPAVINLQTSLKGLAQVTGRPGIDPGDADGIVGNKTMMAIIAGFNIIAEKLPSEAKTALQIALLTGGMTDKSKELVTRFASQLDLATKAATIKYASGAAAPPATTSTTSTTATGVATSWVKTPFGMVTIGVGVLGAAALIYALVK